MSTATLTAPRHAEESPTERPRMTLTEFKALPDDPTVDRMLIRGELWESSRGPAMTMRNRRHSWIESRLSQLLRNWTDAQPEPRPEVYSGEAGCEFPDQESGFGIDVAVFSAETVAAQSDDSVYMAGPPVLAVEILSPSDKQEDVHAKVRDYLYGGVKLIWVVEPEFRTVVVHRPDAEPELFNIRDELTGDVHLPGFRVAVAQLFGR